MNRLLSTILLISILLLYTSCQKANSNGVSNVDDKIIDNENSEQISTSTNEIISDPSTELITTEYSTESITTEYPSESITSEPSDYPKHYEIDLTLDNYMSYLNYSVSSTTKCLDYTHAISGALTYAYYENVVITFEIIYENEGAGEGSGNPYRLYKGEYHVLLNAAGCNTFTADNQNLLNSIDCPEFNRLFQKTFTIKSITGKVIFSI